MYVSYSLAGGGAERLLVNVILQQRERRVRVVALRPGGVFRAVLEQAGVEVVDLGITRYRHAPIGLLRLARLIRAHRPDILHGWDYFSNLLLFPARILARSRARIFWAAFGTDLGTLALKRRFRTVVRLNAFLSRSVDGVAYNGVEVRNYHHSIGFRESRSVIISNATDIEVFQHDPSERAALRHELGLDQNAVVVAVLARVDPQKDWPTVREAVRDLDDVVTVAAGTDTESLPPQRGFVALGWRDDVVRVLSAADIFLLASAFGEGTSLALGEAMLCGLPCIVTDVGGNGRLVGDTGIVVKRGDIAAIRAAIVALAADPEHRRLLGERARTRAASVIARTGGIQRLHGLDLSEVSS